jgi:hypothetical protein
MIQLVTLKDGKATDPRQPCAVRAAGIRRSRSKGKTDPALDESGSRELSILVSHRYPCLLSVSIVDESGRLRRLTSYQPTRPQQLTPDGSFFYWAESLRTAPLPHRRKYAVKVTAYINDTAYKSVSSRSLCCKHRNAFLPWGFDLCKICLGTNVLLFSSEDCML